MYKKEQDAFLSQPGEAIAYLNNGEQPHDAALDPVPVAALAVVAGALLNTDEGVVRR